VSFAFLSQNNLDRDLRGVCSKSHMPYHSQTGRRWTGLPGQCACQRTLVGPLRHNASQCVTKGVSCNEPAQVRKNAGCGGVSLAEIRLQEGESIESALRRFKRKVQTEDIIKEVKRHSYYLKPGAKRRVKQALAQQRARKKLRKEALSSNR
jgi:small subunit ribosomal protein S21